MATNEYDLRVLSTGKVSPYASAWANEQSATIRISERKLGGETVFVVSAPRRKSVAHRTVELAVADFIRINRE